MKLFEIFRKSVYSPEFYRKLLDMPLSFSIKYFYSLVIAFSLALTILFSFRVAPGITSFLKSVGPAALRYYPSELEIKIKNGKASANVAEPYFLKLPAEFSELIQKSSVSSTENLLAIDTKQEFTPKRFRDYKTLVLLTREEVAFWDDKGQIRLQPLEEISDFTINKTLISLFVDRISPLARWAIPVVIFGMFIGFIGFFSLHLFYLFFAAILVWLILKSKGIKAGYKKSYQIAVHAASFGLVLKFLLLTAPGTATIPFLTTVVLLVVLLVNLNAKATVPPPHEA